MRATWWSVGRAHGLERRFAILVGVCAVGAGLTTVRPAYGQLVDEVDVRGEILRPASRDASVGASVVGRERLRAPGLRASEVLRTQPGVQVSETGGAGALATASVRGATAAQTPVYLAGIRINDDIGGTADLALIPLWLVHRVEVYRGNAPLEADRAGIGGAIFFDPERPGDLRPTAGMLVGSFGARAAWTYTGVGTDVSSAAVGLRHDDVDNDYQYVNDQGARFDSQQERTLTRTNADVQTDDLWALGTTRIGKRGRINLLLNGISRRQGLPGLAVLPSRAASARQIRTLAGATINLPCEDRKCDIVTSTSALFSNVTTIDPQFELALNASRIDTEAARWDQKMLSRFQLSRTLSVGSALRASSEYLTINLGTDPAAHARRLTLSAAGSADWRFAEHFTLRTLVNATCDTTAASGGLDQERGPCAQMTPSARLGAEATWGWGRAVVNVGRYARVPTLGERYGLSGTVRGNSTLLPESASVVEGGLRVGNKVAQMDAFAFQRYSQQLIAYARATTGYVVPFNVGSARVQGIELMATLRPLSFLDLEVPFTLLDPRVTTSERMTVNDIIPFRSVLVAAPQLSLRVPDVPSVRLRNAKAAIVYIYQSNRYADAAGLVVIPEQGTCDIEMTAQDATESVRARLRISNVFEQRRFDLIGFPLPGRAVYFAMEAQW